MKKNIIVFCLIFLLCDLGVAKMAHKGDNLGTHKAEQNLDMNSFSITNPGNVDGVDVSQVSVDTTTLSDRLEAIPGSSQRYYMNSNASSFDYEYYGTSTSLQSNPVTFTKTLNGTGIIISSWSVNLGNIATIPAGSWLFEFYANINNLNTTRIYFEVWDGTGIAISEAGNHITTSFLSSPLSQNIEEYFVYVTTINYIPKTRYLSVIMKGNEQGTNPTLSYYAGGIYDAHILLPVLRAEVSVTKITAGNNISISPVSGIGDVTVNADQVSKMDNTVDVVVGTTVKNGSLPPSKFTVVHATKTFTMVFIDTAPICARISNNITFKGMYIETDDNDTVCVYVSSCQTVGGVAVAISTGEDITAGNYLANDSLGAWAITSYVTTGGWLIVYLNDTWITGRPIYVAIKYWELTW
jgi:hypothetical protein